MANPQQENGFVGIARKLYEQLYARNFSVKQLRILMLLLRMSYGCGSKAAFITPQNGFELGCIYKSDIKKELEILEAANVIFCDYKNRLFAINKNYDEWEISFHKLYSSERNQDLIHKNVVSKDTKKSLVENLFVSAELTKKLVHNELSQPEKADSESITGIPKDSIDSIIDNNTIYICNSKEIQIEEKTVKRDDPYTGKIQAKFCAIYKEVFGKPCYLNNAQRIALVEIKFENPDFEENLPILIEKFSKIKFMFDGKVQKVGLRWLLEQGNWSGVLSGDFDNNIEDEKENDGWDL